VELDSEEYDSDNVQPKYDSDDDTQMTDRWPEFNPATDMADPEFEVEMKFSDCKVFRAAVREQFIKRNRDVVFVRNCPWEIYASKMQHEKTLQVKKYEGEHTYGIVWENPTVKSSWLHAKYMETLKSNPISRQQVYRAKERALRQIEGIYTEQYSRIWDYCEELRKTNPGTTTKVQLFQRLYVCLGACKAGFIAGCRPIIGLDGCFLKGVYRGQFLAAVVVESECKESWVWFLELLVKDVEIVNQFGYTFISDKQKGLLLAFEQVVPNSEHKFCARHLFTNFILQFKGKALSDKFWVLQKQQLFH
ncbi:PREDICTED: transposon, partial [Prunus dulcis]